MERTSRTKKKRAAQALQKLGEQLVHLSDAQFAAVELPQQLFEAVAMARQIKSHEARRRQLQYIGRLMRDIDSAMVQGAIKKITSAETEKKRRFKLVERWRDELVDGDETRLDWLIETFPDIDPDELNLLVKNTREKHSQKASKRSGRMLFRYLSALFDGKQKRLNL
ncbi:MAG: ribosome biogenesis factor YjgA [Desulfobacteraceae bacterium]|jgi:ribosome-associated protein